MAPKSGKVATQLVRPKSKSGAKQRATVALIGKKFAGSLDPAALFAFWSARTFLAPPLRTSFGDYTLVNSVDRQTLSVAVNTDTWMWIPWTMTPLACLSGAGGTNITQRVYGTLATASPQYIRPLRMSFQISCVGPALTAAGSIRVYSFDNPIILSSTLPAGATDPATFVNPAPALLALVNDAPDTVEYTAQSLFDEREFVSPPCSYPAYNSYYPFQPFSNVVDGTAVTGRDFLTLATGLRGAYTAGVITTGDVTGALGGLPPVRGFLVTIPGNTDAQLYRVTIRRQDGCRYAVNTLGNTFSMVHPKADSKGEDLLIHSVSQVSTNPAQSMTSDALGKLSGVVATITRDMTEAGKVIGTGLSQGRVMFAHAQDAALLAKNLRAMG